MQYDEYADYENNHHGLMTIIVMLMIALDLRGVLSCDLRRELLGLPPATVTTVALQHGHSPHHGLEPKDYGHPGLLQTLRRPLHVSSCLVSNTDNRYF